MYVCIYMCVYVCMYVHGNVCMYVHMYQDLKLMYICTVCMCTYEMIFGNMISIFCMLFQGTEMTLGESKAAFSALLNYGLLWPGSFILLKDPSISRYTEEYIEVNDVCMSECCCV